MSIADLAFVPQTARQQVDRLIQRVRRVCAGNLTGIYLHGSLAMGCFCPASSDLDVVVATKAGLSPRDRRALVSLLLCLSRDPFPIEISFLRRAYLWPWQYPTPFDLHYSEDWRERYKSDLASDTRVSADEMPRRDVDLAAHITVLRYRGALLWGAPIDDVFPVVPAADYIDSVMRDIYWGIERVAENPAYAVLNMCRTWAYLRCGAILSKAEGGMWALSHLPVAMRPPVSALLARYRCIDAVDQEPPGADVTALVSYLRETVVALYQPR